MISKIQKYCFSIGLIFTILGFVMKAFYRPYIRETGIQDYGLADFSPSFFYVSGFSLLLLIRWYPKYYATIILVTIASVGYEFMQYGRSSNLDIGDILASIFGGLISVIIVRILRKNEK